jgi:hypothetical protein
MNKSFEIIETQFGNFLINEYDLIGNFISLSIIENIKDKYNIIKEL